MKNNLIRSFSFYGFVKFYTMKLLKFKFAKFKTNIGGLFLDLQNDGISKSYAYWGIREQDKHCIIDENLSHGDYVIDCGSNIGGYAKFINNLIGKEGKIICIEPDKRNHNILIKNYEELTCKKEIYFAAMSTNISQAYIKKEKKTNLSKIEKINYPKENYEIINTINFEYLISKTSKEELRKFKLIRMDIEGHEIEVLADLYNHIESFPKLDIIFEVHSEYYNAKKFKDILLKFKDIYKFDKIITAGGANLEIITNENLIFEKELFSDGYKRFQYTNIDYEKGIELTLNVPRVLRYVYLKRVIV